VSGLTNAQLAQQISDLITSWRQLVQQMAALLTGPADGGDNGDGTYPVSDLLGQSYLLDGYLKIIDTVKGPAAQAETALALAEAARDAAKGYSDTVAGQLVLAQAAQVAATAARDLAKQYRDQAASSAANAKVWADNAANAAVAINVDLDGGCSSTVYLTDQAIDAGSASSTFTSDQDIDCGDAYG